ncbi:uncharacterized protein [Clytia hemisphaerica]|uniref:Hexosyltransferase n=1 Tax=Clytia hemisphaerica TaxID=252671 RepID=A0A7M5XIG5_9CNID|eukprot:TCONS_00004766-protein
MNIIFGKIISMILTFLIIWNVWILMTQKDDQKKPSEKDIFIDRFDEFLAQQDHDKKNIMNGRQGKLDSRVGSIGKNTFLDSTHLKRGYINVYYYIDICHNYDNYATKWNILFPEFPAKAELQENFYDERIVNSERVSRRMIAFLQPDLTENYSFRIESQTGCEVRIIEGPYFGKERHYDTFMLQFGLYKGQLQAEKNTNKPGKVYTVTSHEILLQKGKKYLIDVLHALPGKGFLRLKWKCKKEEHYMKIDPSLLTTLYSKPKVTDILPNVKYDVRVTEKSELLAKDRRLMFHQLQNIEQKMVKECEYWASYIPDRFPPDHGVAYVVVDKVYPKDVLIEHHDPRGYYDLYIDEKTAMKVAKKFMGTLSSEYKLKHIVHIEENKETKQLKRYFIEVDVNKHGSEALYRYSGWIIVKEDESSEICQPRGYKWKRDEKIYLITPVKNQARWVRFMIKHLNDIMAHTNERHIHLILYDFGSTDANLKEILQQATFEHSYMRNEQKFSKVIGLNRAVSSIQEEDPIIFILDLQLQLPIFLFDYIRKHTFREKTVYVPILLRLGCGEHTAFTKLTDQSIWQEIGYGMIALFKSDWLKIGGMNETRFSQKWGGEDWEFVDRVLINKMEVIHHRLPGYYHIYHSNKNTWDGTKN